LIWNNAIEIYFVVAVKYDKQDRQGKAAFNERSPHPTQQQAPAANLMKCKTYITKHWYVKMYFKMHYINVNYVS
jgi:hypothetical protein